PAAATVQGTVTATDIPLDLADAMRKAHGRLLSELGRTLQASVKVNGGLYNATADLDAAIRGGSSQGAGAKLALKIESGVLTLREPGELRVDGAGLVPVLHLAQTESVNIQKWPQVAVRVEKLRVPIPQGGGQPVDLRGALVSARVQMTEVVGR